MEKGREVATHWRHSAKMSANSIVDYMSHIPFTTMPRRMSLRRARIKNFRESFAPSQVFHVDVRDLFNLAGDRNLCGHVGLHLKNIRNIGQHPKLDELLTAFGRIIWDQLKYFRQSAEADGQRTLIPAKPAEADLAMLNQPTLLIFWCKSGRHRSVAMADFAAWHLTSDAQASHRSHSPM
eukprot:5952855-Amphidinium_carterae.1